MKALVYTAPNRVVYREAPDPVPAQGEVLIEVDAVGICGSDMHAYQGHDPRRVPPADPRPRDLVGGFVPQLSLWLRR